MPLGVLALVLAAAFARAGWNFLAKDAEGGTRATGAGGWCAPGRSCSA
jgi:hypothetical protein